MPLCVRLLGRHVGRRSDEALRTLHAALRVPLGFRVTESSLRKHETEVHDTHPAARRDHDVVGLEIAMHEPDRMGRCDSAPGRTHHRQDLLPTSRRLLGPRTERLPLDEFHRHEDPRLVLTDVVNRDNLGVRELGQQLGFAQQTSMRVRVQRRSIVAPQQLDRDFAIELGIVGGIHHTHSTGAELAEDHIATDDLAGVDRRTQPSRMRDQTELVDRLGSRQSVLERTHLVPTSTVTRQSVATRYSPSGKPSGTG